MKQRGATLLELLVATAIGMVILTAVFYAFYSCVQLMRWVSVNNDVGQAAMLGLNTLSRGLRSSDYTSITIEPGPVSAANGTQVGPVIAFQLEYSDPTASMGMGFQADQFVDVWYLDQTHQALMQKHWRTTDPAPPGVPASGVRMLPSNLLTVLNTINGTERVMAANINVTATTPGLVISPSTFPTSGFTNGISLTLDVKETPQHGSPEEQVVTTTVNPRNPPP